MSWRTVILSVALIVCGSWLLSLVSSDARAMALGMLLGCAATLSPLVVLALAQRRVS